MRVFLFLGSISMFLSVALGAFGAHGLSKRLSDDMMKVYHTGVEYQFYHSLGLLLIALLADKLASQQLTGAAGWVMAAGIVIFSGSLYVLSISGVKWLGAITPIGGLAFLAAWIMLAVAALKG